MTETVIRRQGFNSKAPPELLKPSNFKPRTVDVPVLNLSLFDLAETSCRYPTTDDKPFLFCGVTRQQGSAYCRDHHSLCNTRDNGHSDGSRRRAYIRTKRRFVPATISLADASV